MTDLDGIRTITEEPASDDFHIFGPLTCARPFGADEQVSFDARRRASAFLPLNYWQKTPTELKHLASAALKVLGFMSRYASVERACSIARSVTMDYQMAVRQETVSARVMIQTNWRVARRLLANVVAMGRAGRSQAYRELKQRQLTQHTPRFASETPISRPSLILASADGFRFRRNPNNDPSLPFECTPDDPSPASVRNATDVEDISLPYIRFDLFREKRGLAFAALLCSNPFSRSRCIRGALQRGRCS
jgi:hypothetical protein